MTDEFIGRSFSGSLVTEDTSPVKISQAWKMKHILDLNKEEKSKFLNSFDLVLLDCDGVVWTAVGPIPKSGDVLNLLLDHGKRIAFVSNNSINTDSVYKKKFEDIGVSNASSIEVIHPAKTIANYLRKTNFTGRAFVIASPEFHIALQQAGFDVLDRKDEIYNGIRHFADNVVIEKDVTAVILDMDLNTNIIKLAKAQQYLQDPRCQFILGATDDRMPLTEHMNIFCIGAFSKLLTLDCGKEPVVLGKPGKELEIFLKEHFSIENPKRVLFIGDALVQDINFGRNAGFQTLLVLSGVTSKEQLFAFEKSNGVPNFYANSLADFIEFFSENN